MPKPHSVRAHRTSGQVRGSRSPALTEVLQLVGNRVQRARTALGLSQREVARLAGLDRAYLSGIEHGKSNVSLSTLLRLATALETDIPSLLPDPRS